KRVVPLLPPRVTNIAARHQGLVEKDVLSLFGADSMPLPVLVRICFVPFETGTGIEGIVPFRHITEYISAIYARQAGRAKLHFAQSAHDLSRAAAQRKFHISRVRLLSRHSNRFLQASGNAHKVVHRPESGTSACQRIYGRLPCFGVALAPSRRRSLVVPCES